MRFLHVSVTIAIAFLLAIGSLTGVCLAEQRHGFVNLPVGAAPEVFTLLDYFERGRGTVERLLRAADQTTPGLLDGIDDTMRACVRIELRADDNGDAYRSFSASGVLIDEGRLVLTAGHVVEGRRDAQVVVTFLGGETREATVLAGHYDPYGGAASDWAVLEIAGRPVRDYPAATLAPARRGEPAMILGYPDRIGVDAAGQVAFDAGDGRYLEPLITLARVESAEPLLLEPRTGSVPTSGMSGAPVFDSAGRVIGIFVAVHKSVGAENVTYRYAASPPHAAAAAAPATIPLGD